MPLSTSDELFNLIKGLNKSEKRNFKLYTNRIQSSEESRFVQLFDILDKAKSYNRKDIMQRMHPITKSQLSNLKRHLYSQLLISLRLLHKKSDISIEIREQLDFARILYSKGLYMQSLKLLDRVKEIADGANQDLLHFEILEFEKLIEEKHITRSRGVANKMETLIDESSKQSDVVSRASDLTNLKLKIHGLYIKYGHAKDPSQAKRVRDLYEKKLKDLESGDMGFFENTYLHQAYVWYYYILLDLEKCAYHAEKWVDNFHKNPEMIGYNPDNYMRGIHYLFTANYYLGKSEPCERALQLFTELSVMEEVELNKTSEIILFLYENYSALDYYVLRGDYENAINLIEPIQKKLSTYHNQIDEHRILTFYYRFAWLHFARTEYNEAIDYLNRIINLKAKSLREDIQGYTWLLYLLCHYEKKNFRLLGHLIPTAVRFFDKMKDKNQVQIVILDFIKTQLKPNVGLDEETLRELKNTLTSLSNNPFENKALIYIDLVKWIDARIQKKSIAALTY